MYVYFRSIFNEYLRVGDFSGFLRGRIVLVILLVVLCYEKFSNSMLVINGDFLKIVKFLYLMRKIFVKLKVGFVVFFCKVVVKF